MTWRASAACWRLALGAGLVVLVSVSVSGCAAWAPAKPGANTASGAATGAATGANTNIPTAETGTAASPLGVEIFIDAPSDLKALLEKYLDVVRLGKLPRDEVDDTEWLRLIEAAPAQVRELLQTEGYFAPQVSLSREAQPQKDKASVVRLRVEAGPRARVMRVSLEAEGELQQAAARNDAYASATMATWRSSWALPVGQEFRNPAWADAKAAALARLRAAGFANAVWIGTAAEVSTPGESPSEAKGDTESDTKRDTNREAKATDVRLFLVVDSGPLFRYGQLVIEGMATQDAVTVQNLLATRKGSPVTEALLLDFQDRLVKSGLFESVTVTLDTRTQQAEQAAIVVRVKESPLQTYTFGLGLSTNTGPRASVEHIYRRVFGYPAQSRNKLELGKKRQAWNGEISTHPLDALQRYLLGGAIERLVSDDDNVLSQRLRLGRAQDKQSVERLHFLEFERSRRVTGSGQRDEARSLTLNFHGSWRDLDNIVLPTRGVTLSVQVSAGQSGGTGATSGFYPRLYGRLTGYLPLGQSWYGQARVELGQVFLRTNMVAPESQKWRAGGDDSVRGYAYRSLGPLAGDAVGGGNSVFTASAEVARPFLASMPSLWGALFVDTGNAANRFGQLDPVLGYGVGLRWRSPVGPLRLDYAYGESTRKTRLHFSIGIAF
jgi:translocation and assembly module TamA